MAAHWKQRWKTHITKRISLGNSYDCMNSKCMYTGNLILHVLFCFSDQDDLIHDMM